MQLHSIMVIEICSYSKSDKEKFCFHLKNKPLFFRIDPDYECPCKVVVSDVVVVSSEKNLFVLSKSRRSTFFLDIL